MTVQNKEFYLAKQEMKKSQLKRCIICGYDHEILMPQVLKVNNITWVKLHEIAVKESHLHLSNTGYCIPNIDGTVDDLTLKPINGMSYQVSIDLCLECIDKIGYRHKYKNKYVNRQYATKWV